ncbi:MAG TPA: imidazole glycerol phosphate synthase subunit HisH [Actinocrinis sp.]|nr:imidazole glycerol phosphate synthase subunit HisH [Actinocrinis sp.]
MTRVVILDYGFGNIRSAQRAVAHHGVETEVSSDFEAALNADGLLVPGVGAFAACMAGLRAVGGDRLIGRRLAGGRPVLGICVGMQILFERGVEHGQAADGCAEWPGSVEPIDAPVVPHMGWNTVSVPEDSAMFADLDETDRFYFVHSYAAQDWHLNDDGPLARPKVAWCDYGTRPFVAAVQNGPLWATQFHPEKSGAAGARLLGNWIKTL